jgi:hypothetical protein
MATAETENQGSPDKTSQVKQEKLKERTYTELKL